MGAQQSIDNCDTWFNNNNMEKFLKLDNACWNNYPTTSDDIYDYAVQHHWNKAWIKYLENPDGFATFEEYYEDQIRSQFGDQYVGFRNIKESFIEGNTTIDDNSALAAAANSAAISSSELQSSLNRAHSSATQNVATDNVDDIYDSANKASQYSDVAYTGAVNSYNNNISSNSSANSAKNAANEAQQSANSAQGSADQIANTVTDVNNAATEASNTITDFVTDISNNAEYSSNIISLTTASLSPSNSGSAMTNYINEQQSVDNINIINTLLNSAESSIGFKKEGFSNSTITDLLEYLKFKEETTATSLKQEISKELEQTTYDRTSELLLQKDNILSRLISDYMINGETGTNVEKVYEDLKQKNNDELRKIQIKSYYNKAYKEYIFILKVVICLIVLLIPIIFLNKYEYIDNNKTLISVVFIITIGVLFIGYRLYLLYLKDDIDYDRIRIPYDRQASELIKQGKMESKDSVFKNLGVTCIGDECCDVSMVYDNLNNKCILSENFGGYFESMQNKNKETFNVIEPYNITTHNIENFTTDENLSSTKERLLRESLVRSSNTRM